MHSPVALEAPAVRLAGVTNRGELVELDGDRSRSVRWTPSPAARATLLELTQEAASGTTATTPVG